VTARVDDPSFVDPRIDSRSVSFENPTGARGRGGRAGGGRKGAPAVTLLPGETIVLADLDGPGTIRHLWMTFPPGPPEVMRALWLEVRYDGADDASVAVPCVDFFGVAHGRPVPYASALTTIQGDVGFNAFFPMPFRDHLEVRLTNGSDRPQLVFYQLDYTLDPEWSNDRGYLHAEFRRENPTVPQRDFVIAECEGGAGRFLGCVVGVRVVDEGAWYGEGEVKMYRDGDRDAPTICGTGLEDYVCSAWGLAAHHAPYAGAPLDVRHASGDPGVPGGTAFVSFYRWHVLDPVMFSDELRVTIQQIGSDIVAPGDGATRERLQSTRTITPAGWHELPGGYAVALSERSDDYCASSFVYRLEPRGVMPLDVGAATADVARLPHEQPFAAEGVLAG
jgi:D-arabinan exo alpha-(1,3)/(1,5)-arabinofuranosidase (non-reducing end)